MGIMLTGAAGTVLDNQVGSIRKAGQFGPEFSYLDNLGRFTYRCPDLDGYQAEKKLAVIANANTFANLSQESNLLLTPSVLTEPDHRKLKRIWDYFFRLRLEKIILQHDFDVPALFPGHTVSSVNGTHYRGTLFYEQYLDMLSFGGGLPEALCAKEDAVETAPLEQGNSLWPWMFFDEPKLLSIVPTETFDGIGSGYADIWLQNISEQLMTEFGAGNLPIEHILNKLHKLWTSDIAFYSPLALLLAEQIIEQVKLQISPSIFLPFMFELEVMTSMFSYLSKLNIFASGVFEGNWLEVAELPVLSCRGSELCNEDRLFQELLKLSKGCFAPLVVNENGNVCDGNHRLTAVWIWNLLKACGDCDWDLGNLQFQKSVAAYLSTQEAKLHAVSVHQALSHLGVFLKDPSKSELLRKQMASDMAGLKRIEKLPVVLLPEYLSSAVIKDLFDETGRRVRVQPHICELIKTQPDMVLPERGTYHFADCVPLPWFSVIDDLV